MENIIYLSNLKINISETIKQNLKGTSVIYKDDIIYVNRSVWINSKYDNHNMALMLIEMLYKCNMINEATYRKIMSKNQIMNRVQEDAVWDTKIIM